MAFLPFLFDSELSQAGRPLQTVLLMIKTQFCDVKWQKKQSYSKMLMMRVLNFDGFISMTQLHSLSSNRRLLFSFRHRCLRVSQYFKHSICSGFFFFFFKCLILPTCKISQIPSLHTRTASCHVIVCVHQVTGNCDKNVSICSFDNYAFLNRQKYPITRA